MRGGSPRGTPNRNTVKCEVSNSTPPSETTIRFGVSPCVDHCPVRPSKKNGWTNSGGTPFIRGSNGSKVSVNFKGNTTSAVGRTSTASPMAIPTFRNRGGALTIVCDTGGVEPVCPELPLPCPDPPPPVPEPELVVPDPELFGAPDPDVPVVLLLRNPPGKPALFAVGEVLACRCSPLGRTGSTGFAPGGRVGGGGREP